MPNAHKALGKAGSLIIGPRLHYNVQSSVHWYQRESSKPSDTTWPKKFSRPFQGP